jgi:hypothetical protein
MIFTAPERTYGVHNVICRMFALVVLLAMTLGCAHQSVYHLNRVPLVSGGVEQTLDLDYWRFTFTTMEREEGLHVLGVAHPRQSVIPLWAVWIEDLWMEAYLSDERGHVLAKHLRVFDSRPLDYGLGVPFSFTMRPSEMGRPGRVYVSFGYRVVVSRSASEKTMSAPGKKDVFFASEGALTRY